MWSAPPLRDGRIWHYLDDGVYGSYSNVLTEDVHPPILALREMLDGGPDEHSFESVTLAGPTCDSADVVAHDYPMPPLSVGDIVVSPMMGAYTSVTSSRFNGIAATPIVVGLSFVQRARYPRRVRSRTVVMAHHDDRTHRGPREIRLLGAQRQRRSGDQRHRAAHRLELRLQREARADRGEQRLRVRAVARSATRPATAPSTSTSRPVSRLALLLATQRLKVIAAVHPGLWHPAVLAKLGATADHLSGGRFAVNVVSGWFKDEFTHLGEPWLEHDERYRRSAEFLQVIRKIWTEDDVDFRGDFYRIHDFTLKPKPLNTAERPESRDSSRAATPRPRAATAATTPTGTSPTARTSTGSPSRSSRSATTRATPAARSSSVSTASSSPATQRRKQRKSSARSSRRPTGPAVEGFSAAVQQAGNSTGDKRGMWADSTFEDLVQYNDGFRTQLIGTPEQIAERIAAYRKRGVDLILGGFLHFQEEIEYFGARVLPLVREIEAPTAIRSTRRAGSA